MQFTSVRRCFSDTNEVDYTFMLLLFYSTHKKDVWKCIIKFIKNVLACIDTHFVPHMDSIVVRRSRDGLTSCFIWLWFYTQRAVRESIYNDINLTGVIVKFKTVLSSSFYPSSLDLFFFFTLVTFTSCHRLIVFSLLSRQQEPRK